LLASVNIPIRYTASNLSPALVATARKRLKGYHFLGYRVVDIEKALLSEFLRSKHFIIATNCVHATHNLLASPRSIHQILRPDRFPLMLEITEALPWMDLLFGLLDGWWLFQ
jgi:hypothetical protein